MTPHSRKSYGATVCSRGLHELHWAGRFLVRTSAREAAGAIAWVAAILAATWITTRAIAWVAARATSLEAAVRTAAIAAASVLEAPGAWATDTWIPSDTWPGTTHIGVATAAAANSNSDLEAEIESACVRLRSFRS